MRVYARVPGCSRQILAVAVGDVLPSLRVSEALGEAEVNHVDVMLLFPDSNEEIVRFDVPVQEVARVHELNPLQLPTNKHHMSRNGSRQKNWLSRAESDKIGLRGGGREKKTYHLIGEHEDGFEGELALAVVEKVLETRPEQVNHHHVVVTLHAKPVHVWDANYKK